MTLGGTYWFVVPRYWLLSAIVFPIIVGVAAMAEAFHYPLLIFPFFVVFAVPITFLLTLGGFMRVGRLAPPAGEKLLFSRKWVSGHSNRNLYTKLAGGSRSLTVQVSKDFLYIRPNVFQAPFAD